MLSIESDRFPHIATKLFNAKEEVKTNPPDGPDGSKQNPLALHGPDGLLMETGSLHNMLVGNDERGA